MLAASKSDDPLLLPKESKAAVNTLKAAYRERAKVSSAANHRVFALLAKAVLGATS